MILFQSFPSYYLLILYLHGMKCKDIIKKQKPYSVSYLQVHPHWTMSNFTKCKEKTQLFINFTFMMEFLKLIILINYEKMSFLFLIQWTNEFYLLFLLESFFLMYILIILVFHVLYRISVSWYILLLIHSDMSHLTSLFLSYFHFFSFFFFFVRRWESIHDRHSLPICP